MFSNKKDDETDFCESYKSEILGATSREKERSFFSTLLKLLTILILLVIIIAVSFYGYNYYINTQQSNDIPLPPVSIQISEDDLVVQPEDTEIEVPSVEEIPPLIESETSEVKKVEAKEEEINQIANDVKIAIAQSESLEENTSSDKKVEETPILVKDTVNNLEVPTASPEAKYLEELADLSKEIDKEIKQ
ncbi:MAG: Unknown protein [uncultured Sulfurovum sp.]|uniref:Uncharacterized protein n=1 Tax=uncultured Sulfurovum sp. TaxID=269237 RepID=A0A6S6TV60_9BACT|nr:MAG: Unknown protein [uncultured Sulfurovum sp.]